MRFSKSVKSSLHCLPSPDGSHIATLFATVVNVRAVTVINVRAVRNLEVVNVIRPLQDFAGPIVGFQWSPSSRLLLVSNPVEIRVVSALDDSFNATIRNPVAPGTKPAFVGFGTSDTEVCVIAAFGLKFAVYDLASSKAVEIGSPKIFSLSAAARCFSFRPRTHHLALLTRTAGKDHISLHAFPTRELQRSWAPDTVDAQGLLWSPDGRWLIVWDSAAQGHKLLFYTSDGHIFKTWSGPANPAPEHKDYATGAGIRTVQFSADARHLAIGDYSRSLYLFNMTSVTEAMRLQHPSSLVPRDTLQIWQEQVGISQAGPSIHTFMRTSHAISPSTRPQEGPDPASGCVSVLFDPSSALVATRLDDSPGTVWIWDLQAAELRAALLFHGNIGDLFWHPTIHETLLIRCEGEQYGGVVFVWDPLSEGPRSVDFSQQLPAKVVGKSRALWLGRDTSSSPSLFLSDAQNYVLASLIELDQGEPPWGDDYGVTGLTGDGRATMREESPLELVPAADIGHDEDDSELEDTFIHKR
ncbi:hypothetical protein B0T16DRAFT_458523 [Cercophora newfieldiana]|uniref:WD40 domain-containing protein n=1 Tax=Cercophora newfieldiana TaxID=92897 RepID=A0AA40CRM4_9PEZI|nr:hypothetical protein B0T16DRAFT_458523 [Cercophora newfieldiana]